MSNTTAPPINATGNSQDGIALCAVVGATVAGVAACGFGEFASSHLPPKVAALEIRESNQFIFCLW